ncbi:MULTISPECIES: YuiB family protein [Bacillaceae]|uniref:YuiB family protein n=1 Tax=Evansella alkalicola TaxID=745819 RepID=A0ABS6JU76_9BACI|nr:MULTISPECIES: YuiB family protein [Bacillaceae]MBU9722117.1 YuiB family protein [Bacillus alkalicola]
MLSLPQLIIAIVLYFVLFFGIGFILNMLLRSTWTMAVIYPIVIFFIVDESGLLQYFLSPGEAFPTFFNDLIALKTADIIILSAGMAGAILSGIANRMLRNRGYQMF